MGITQSRPVDWLELPKDVWSIILLVDYKSYYGLIQTCTALQGIVPKDVAMRQFTRLVFKSVPIITENFMRTNKYKHWHEWVLPCGRMHAKSNEQPSYRHAGTSMWHYDGQVHSYDDQPALITPEYIAWLHHGKAYRKHGPAVIRKDGRCAHINGAARTYTWASDRDLEELSRYTM